MTRHKARLASSIVLALVLTGCGGGGGESGSSAVAVAAAPAPSPSPSPTPTPSPSPTPTPTPLAGPAALTQVQDFAVLGQPSGIAFRYDAGAARNELMIPGRGWAALGAASTLGGVFSHQSVLIGPDPVRDRITLDLFIPGAGNRTLALSHTSYGAYCCDAGEGKFAYGVATSPGAVPRNGLGQYRGVIFDPYSTTGDASITIDFASGRVTGSIKPIFNDGIGGLAGPDAIPFEGILPANVSAFQISFLIGSTGRTGLLEVQLTGPGAEELMLRWSATIVVPHLSLDAETHILTGVARRN